LLFVVGFSAAGASRTPSLQQQQQTHNPNACQKRMSVGM